MKDLISKNMNVFFIEDIFDFINKINYIINIKFLISKKENKYSLINIKDKMLKIYFNKENKYE